MEKSKKDLAEYRLAKAKEHLKSAEYLFQKDCFMDSISRSYYAIFAAARSMLALKEMDSSKHSGVINDLRIPPANRLETLKGKRKGQHKDQ